MFILLRVYITYRRPAGFVTADDPARTWSGDDIVIAGDAPSGEKQPGSRLNRSTGNGEEGSESAEPGK